jgi:hypothetical protein
MTYNEFQKGDKVYFGRKNGEKTLGEIVRVNRRSYTIKQLESRGLYRDYAVGTKWKVAKSLVWSAEEGRPEHITSRPRPRPCLVNILTGKRTYGYPGESGDSLYGRMANGLM